MALALATTVDGNQLNHRTEPPTGNQPLFRHLRFPYDKSEKEETISANVALALDDESSSFTIYQPFRIRRIFFLVTKTINDPRTCRGVVKLMKWKVGIHG